MRKINFIISLFFALTLSIGQVWGAEQVAYTLTPASGSNNSYANNCDITIGGITWNLTGNSTMQPWRIGGKNLSGVDRSLYSKTAISDNISKIEITHAGASSVTVNSMKVEVASDANFSTIVSTLTPTFVASGTVTVNRPNNTDWTGKYYRITYNVTIGGSNKFIAFSEAKFYKEVSKETCVTPTFSPAAGTFYGSQEITLATTTSGASIYYTTNGTTPSSSNGTLYQDPFVISSTTTIKAIAIKDDATDSNVAEATYTAGATITSYAIDFETNNLTAYVNWDFVNIACATSTISAHGGTYYGNTDGKTTASITTKEIYAAPGTLTFYTSKESGNTTSSSWIAQVSDDGETWTDVEPSFDATTGSKGEWTERTADLSAHTNVYVRIAYSGSTAIRAIDDISLATASSVAKPTISGEESFVTSTTVTLSCTTSGADIYYTTDGSDPKSGTKYSSPFTLNATKTVKAIAKLGSDWSTVAEKVFTQITPLTVAGAKSAIDAAVSNTLANQYVKGIISKIDGYNNNTITYWISDDGTTTNQFEVYKGKGLNNTNFSDATDLNVGDDVTVFGTIKLYNNTTYEFDQNNYIVYRKPIAILSWSNLTEGAFSASLEDENTYPALSKPEGVSVTYSSSNIDIATINESTGAITPKAVGQTTITATFAGNDTYKANSASYILNIASSVLKADISFEENGGSTVTDLTAQTNLPSPLPTTTKNGKNFGGWYLDSNFATLAQAGAVVDSNDPITLYAKWLAPYTIDQAKAVIDATPAGTANQYVAGKISQIDSYNSTYNSITYWISDDGATSNQIQVYSGLIGNAATPLDKDKFSATTDLELGDEVVVLGTLKLHNSTVYEFDKNNIIYSFNRPEKPSITADPATVSNVAVEGVKNQTIALIYENIDNYETEVSVHPDAEGEETLSPAWLTASVSGADNYAVITYSVSANDGAARTAYIKVYATDGDKEATKIISVSQVKYEAPAAPASLPFAFDGATSDIESTQGMSQDGLGSYNNSPKLKFDGTGDWVIIEIDSDPGKLTYDIIGNGFSGGTFTVQESANGTDYTDVVAYTELGTKSSEEKDLTKTTRFVKFIYTNKSSGNVALGNIAIAKYVESATLQSIAISGQPETTTYDAGNVFDITGLVVTGTYNIGDPAAITEGITWEVRTNSTSDAVALANYSLTQGQTALQVRATVGNIESDWKEVTGLTVKEHVVTPGKYDILLNNALWGSELTGSLSGANLKDYSGSQNDISFAYNKGTSSNMYFNANQTRLYNGNELVITAPTGYVIEKVEGLVETVQANAGTITDNVWTGKVNSVTFSHKNSTGNSQLGTISVTFAVDVPAAVTTPTFSPAAGTYTSAQNVTITCETDGATIYYTTDGTDPDNTSTQYTSAITVGATTTIKAIAYKDNEHSDVATAVYTIDIPEGDDDVTGTWILVSNASQLAYGKKVIIAYYSGEETKTMGKQNTSNRAAVASVAESINGVLTLTAIDPKTKAFTLVDAGDSKYAFQASNGKYLCAASSGSNYLKDQETNNDEGKWAISIDGGNATITAQGSYTRNQIRYNPNTSNNNPLFACYASTNTTTGSLVCLFVLQEHDVTYNLNGGEGTTPTQDAVRKGAKITLHDGETGITAPEGQEFDGWLCDIDGVKYDARAEYTMTDAATTFTAQWKDVETPQEPEREIISENLTPGKIGTFCPSQNISAFIGASFYTITDIEYAGNNPYKIIFDEIAENESLQAGHSYIYVAEDSEIKGVKSGDQVANSEIDNNDGFIGWTVADTFEVTIANRYFMVYNNEIRLCGLGWFQIPAGRAIIDITKIQQTGSAPAPGRRRVSLINPAAAPQVTTDIDALTNDGKAVKVIINDKMFIIRNGQMFDTTGRLVK